MGYLDNMSWEKLRKELQFELEKGLGVIKNGAVGIQKKAEELTEEGKRQYKMLSTKSKIHDAMRDLGENVYRLMRRARTKNPALDARVKAIAARLKSLEAELAKLEVKAGASPHSEVSKSRAAAHAQARKNAGITPHTRARRRVKKKSTP